MTPDEKRAKQSEYQRRWRAANLDKVRRRNREFAARKRLEDGITPRLPLEARFWASVSKDAECWNWTGPVNKYGYGKTIALRKHVTAHRLSYELMVGAIPNGMCVCHRCDNRLCVRPDHLFLASNDENMRDMVVKGRSPRGERNAQAKLTAQQATAIRHSPLPLRELIARYGISESQVLRIRNRQCWKHLP